MTKSGVGVIIRGLNLHLFMTLCIINTNLNISQIEFILIIAENDLFQLKENF